MLIVYKILHRKLNWKFNWCKFWNVHNFFLEFLEIYLQNQMTVQWFRNSVRLNFFDIDLFEQTIETVKMNFFFFLLFLFPMYYSLELNFIKSDIWSTFNIQMISKYIVPQADLNFYLKRKLRESNQKVLKLNLYRILLTRYWNFLHWWVSCGKFMRWKSLKPQRIIDKR